MFPRTNRRGVLLAAGATALAGIPASPTVAADPQGNLLRLGKPVPLTSVGLPADALKFSANISPDGRAITILFDSSFQFSLDQSESALTKTWVASLQIPQAILQQPPPPMIVYSSIARGSVDKAAAARVVVTLDLGSTPRVVDFPFGKATRMDWDATVLSPTPSVEKESTSEQGKPVVSVFPLFLGYYPATISVTIQRATAQDTAVVSLQSIDIETPSANQARPAASKVKAKA